MCCVFPHPPFKMTYSILSILLLIVVLVVFIPSVFLCNDFCLRNISISLFLELPLFGYFLSQICPLLFFFYLLLPSPSFFSLTGGILHLYFLILWFSFTCAVMFLISKSSISFPECYSYPPCSSFMAAVSVLISDYYVTFLPLCSFCSYSLVCQF